MSKFTVIAGILGFLGVVLGAFGAHGLEEQLGANDQLDNWRTATLYLFVHTLAILALSGFGASSGLGGLGRIAWFWVAGVVLFSGSLYILAVTNISKLGMVTPFGGLCFIFGWLLLAISAYKGGGKSGQTTQSS